MPFNMQRLFDPSKHEPIKSMPWSEGAALDGVQHIAHQTCLAFSPKELWPSHPLDDLLTPQTRCAGLYDGAGGALWTLRHFKRLGLVDNPPEFSEAVTRLVALNHQWAALQDWQTPSFLLGNSGLLMLHWQFDPGQALENRLHDVIYNNLDHFAQDALWGNPGTAVAAIHMAEATGSARWKQLVQECVNRLENSLESDPETGTPIWTQNIYGKRTRFLGAGHGMVGNTYVALRGAKFLDSTQVQRFSDNCLETLLKTALHDDGCSNWHPMSDKNRVANRLPPVQDCHGAAGVVNRLSSVPRTAQWDALLLAAGELIWRAGPLVKGPGLCHGTAGNALALLKLANRFEDDIWLGRARSMALHAYSQVKQQHKQFGQARHALWTGDLGVAWVLWLCIEKNTPSIPTLDVF